MKLPVYEYQWSWSFFDLGQRSLGFQTFILFFSNTVGLLEPEYHVKTYGSTGMKIYISGVGHMTRPYIVKTIKILLARTSKPIAI